MILAVESSCDETALAYFNPRTGQAREFLHSQLDLHKEYGGVVPELASRAHLEMFPILLNRLIASDGFTPDQVTQIAVTIGPGLAPCLALGISHARSLATAWKLPLCPVNHLRGHAYSVFMDLHSADPQSFSENLSRLLPQLGLLVSGGNTLLFEIKANLDIRILAQTIDDAAGEALDKGAKLLGLDYPGGALLEKNAKGGDPEAFDFPRAFAQKDDMRFSYSGLKTSLRYRLEKLQDREVEKQFANLCASYQEAVIDQLISKTHQALIHGNYQSIGLSGGVANNLTLRSHLTRLTDKYHCPLFLAQPRHCGDNASMIAFAAFLHPQASQPKLELQPALTLA
jgi:N6-L-threonylcarbamoyladenine synthase